MGVQANPNVRILHVTSLLLFIALRKRHIINNSWLARYGYRKDYRRTKNGSFNLEWWKWCKSFCSVWVADLKVEDSLIYLCMWARSCSKIILTSKWKKKSTPWHINHLLQYFACISWNLFSCATLEVSSICFCVYAVSACSMPLHFICIAFSFIFFMFHPKPELSIYSDRMWM